MKNLLCLLCLLFVLQLSYPQNMEDRTENRIYQSYTENFFNMAMKKLSVYPDYKRMVGKLICKPSPLDSILMQNPKLHVTDNLENFIPFSNKNTTSLVFRVQSEKEIEGLKDYNSYQAGKMYFNNVFVIFELQSDSIYLMTDLLYKPLNQGVCGPEDINLVYNSGNKRLYLRQFGGNRFGLWGAEFEFEFDEVVRKWMHVKSSLYTASRSYLGVFKNEKLIWSKKPIKRLPIEDVYYPDYFKYTDLAPLMQ